jgi:hypothetical protein
MANNSFPRNFEGVTHTALNTADLAVGDKLIRVIRQGGNWGSRTRWTETEVTVTKVLKNRLVVARADGLEYRVLVANSKAYPYNNGKVGNTLEGDASNWHTDDFLLFTPDDEELPLIRERVVQTNKAIEVKQAAKASIDDLFNAGLTVDNAQAAIEALTAWIATQETE